MSSLSQNINQAINDFDSIKTAIEDKGVTVGNVPTSEYAGKIGEIQTGQEIMFSADGRCYTTDIVIPDGTTSIGNYAFSGCTNLESVTISNSVTTIGNQAFAHCTSLTSITIPNSVTVVGGMCFANCPLQNIVLGNNFNATGLWFIYNNLSVDVMVSMFEALADLTGQTAKTLTLGATNLAKLTDEQKQIATNKNWNLA